MKHSECDLFEVCVACSGLGLGLCSPTGWPVKISSDWETLVLIIFCIYRTIRIKLLSTDC